MSVCSTLASSNVHDSLPSTSKDFRTASSGALRLIPLSKHPRFALSRPAAADTHPPLSGISAAPGLTHPKTTTIHRRHSHLVVILSLSFCCPCSSRWENILALAARSLHSDRPGSQSPNPTLSDRPPRNPSNQKNTRRHSPDHASPARLLPRLPPRRRRRHRRNTTTSELLTSLENRAFRSTPNPLQQQHAGPTCCFTVTRNNRLALYGCRSTSLGTLQAVDGSPPHCSKIASTSSALPGFIRATSLPDTLNFPDPTAVPVTTTAPRSTIHTLGKPRRYRTTRRRDLLKPCGKRPWPRTCSTWRERRG